MPITGLVPPLKVFISYSHLDQEMCKRFLIYLTPLRDEGLIAPWTDRLISAGADWASAIDANLNAADVILLLVSPDFLASDYCKGVEMDRALVRDKNEEARVVPVILKHCEWRNSRFARLQLTPTDGKPVEDWPTWNHGFEDVVAALRKLIAELTASPADSVVPPAPATPVASVKPPVPVPEKISLPPPRRRIWQWVGAATLIVAVVVLWWMWSTSRSFLKQGITYLNDGRYAEAQPPLEQAKKWNPLSTSARCGLEAIRLSARASDTQFKEFVDPAVSAYPNCAYLRFLSGQQKYRAGDLDGALEQYQKAVDLEPRLAEAQFDLGHSLDLAGKPDEAFEHYQQAVTLSPGNPIYHNNLAEMYFRRNRYDDALNEYAKVGEVPLSALNAAIIYRLQGRLPEAKGLEEEAIQWLQRPSAEQVEQGRAWDLDVSREEKKRLASLSDKRCYAELELAMTRYFQKDESVARQKVPATIGNNGTCKNHATDLTQILQWELRQLGVEVPQFTKASDTFAKFLEASNPQ
jgi:tetratricopeptide (TPR) repeat protein